MVSEAPSVHELIDARLRVKKEIAAIDEGRVFVCINGRRVLASKGSPLLLAYRDALVRQLDALTGRVHELRGKGGAS